MDLASLPGFREFFPDVFALREHIFAAWREVAARYGFAEYDGPPLEPLELYTRKSGPEIVEQLYAFTDRGGREVALRPEMTPTFARMISARAAALPKPIRWFSVPQLFRYERPQRGRLREHFQLNMDIVGESDPLADAEVMAAALDVLRVLGLRSEDAVARYSDRALAGGVLRRVGIPESRLAEAFAALDRVDREPEEKVAERLVEAGASPSAADEVLALGGATLDEILAEHGETEAVGAAGGRLKRLLEHLDAFGLVEWTAFDARLVRGLAYYTGPVFELWERRGELRAICGGGRYDGLMADLGGADLPAVGFGMGDVVLGELLRDRDLLPGARAPAEDFVVTVSDEERPLALRVVRALRERGRRVLFETRGRGVGRQFKAADQAGAERAIVIGPEEAARGVATVRAMRSGEEREVPLTDLLGATAVSAPADRASPSSGAPGGRERARTETDERAS